MLNAGWSTSKTKIRNASVGVCFTIRAIRVRTTTGFQC
jgi:hypothetical protein